MTRYPELGAAFSAIHENLAELDARQDRLTECRLAHLEEWAEAAMRTAGEERDMLLQLLSALHPDRHTSLPDGTPAENRRALLEFRRQLSVPERLAVLRAMTDRRGPELYSEIGADTPEISEHAAGKIAYVQNSYSDNAYLQFSNTVHKPRAAYFDSFSDVCEEVYNGICEYGILPLLHEREGKLFRFYSLLEKYDLRVVCACDVPTVERDSVTYTRYALIRKLLSFSKEAYSHMEILLPADSGGSDALYDLLAAARAVSLTPERLDTRTSDSYDGTLSTVHQITLAVGHEEILPFLAFLSLEIPQATVLGLYRVLR